MTLIRMDLSQFLGSLSSAAIGGQAIADNTVVEAKGIYEQINGLDKFSPKRMILGQLEIKADVMLVSKVDVPELDDDASDLVHGHLINQLEQLFKLHNSTQPNINKSIFRKSNSDKTTAFKSELGTLLRGTLKSGLNIFSAKHFLLSKLITLFMNHVDESKDSIGDQIEGVLNHGFKKAENLMTQDKKVASASDESGHAVDQMQIILNSDDDTKIKNAIPASLQITYCSGDDVATCQVEQEKYKQPNVHQI